MKWNLLGRRHTRRYRTTITRLNGLHKHDPDVLRGYDFIITDQLKRGIVEIINPSDDIPENISTFPTMPLCVAIGDHEGVCSL